MMKLRKDLQALSTQLKALAKKTETMTKAVAKLEKAQAVKKAKPKAARRAPVKRKAAVRKRGAKLTATDQVLKLISRSKRGVDVPRLMKKTAFDEKKVRNIVSRAFSQGKIKRVGRGLYVGA